ncbi:MAG: helix-turn-helix domain-containing protein [Bradyrhizobium sp.]|uniref:helix-turn-helix domain-containing protein n=1 Tax=Bradyrhizobium sp. TaxID=376 RepID=UPI00272289C7|nr:helix-turn-helix domain-containing protein [Bradyrhizobium sp.]MDO8396557.1 helix-turn-helix domain-containing protein [Bradyrhizobium sp.]
MKLAYSIQETCGLLSIGRTTLYALIGRGDLTVLKIGRRTLISAKSLDAFIGAVEGQGRGRSDRNSPGDVGHE